MTVYGLLAAITWAALAAFFVLRLDAFARLWLDRTRPLDERSIEIPDDLMALASSENEKWAQDQTIDAIRERFATLQDWQKVRRAFGIGELH